ARQRGTEGRSPQQYSRRDSEQSGSDSRAQGSDQASREGVEVSTLRQKNMFEIFSQGLFEGVKPMMVIRDNLIRHPDRCTHQPICVPICPVGARVLEPPVKVGGSRCLEGCRLCLGACPSQGIFAVFKKGEKVLEPQKKQ